LGRVVSHGLKLGIELAVAGSDPSHSKVTPP